MARKTVSMRGEEVDFDLLDIKAKMQKLEKPLDVKTREDFVHMKRRRRGSLNMEELVKSRKESEEDVPQPTPVPEPPPEEEKENIEKESVESKATNKPKAKRKIVKKD